MKLKPEKLEFPPVACSLHRPLGEYYQDLRSALALIESGYHGEFDEDGIPLVRYGNQGGFRNAVHTAQYALASLSALRAGEFAREPQVRTLLDALVLSQESSGDFAGCWLMEHDNPKYPWLRPPWTSALASGQAVSALLRGWELFGEQSYWTTAEAAYAGLHLTRRAMALCYQHGEELWYEEYPADPPMHVLNGHVYALLGVVDWARVTGDVEAENRWRRAAGTLLHHLDEFDLGYWSAYDLRSREPVSLHYQRNIHVPLLRVLAMLTAEERFAAVAQRWEDYARGIRSRMRWYAESRLYHRRRANPGGLANGGTSMVEAVRSVEDPVPEATALRAFPYPFRAALAICNDADLLAPSEFRRLYRFLSTEEDTEWGPGLGLNLGGSFFLFRSPDSPNLFTVFDRLSMSMTTEGEFVLECARRGLLDVLHTYGCFTDPRHFNRGMAEAGLEVLRSSDVKVETWVNHGPETNVQCIGPHHGWQGDADGAVAYHTDLTVDHGLRWVWTGSEVTDRIALDAAHGTRGWPRAPAGSRNGHRAPLVEPYTLRDGRRVRRFYRYTGIGGRTPVLDDLPKQLAAGNLDELVRSGGYAIVYQHLAVRRVRPGFGTQAYGSVGERWFKPAEVEALQELTRRERDGDIWVAPTTELLRYHDAHQEVRWRTRQEFGHDVIDVQGGWATGGSGAAGLRAGDLANLTFYCPNPETTRVYLETEEGLRQIDSVRANPADVLGRRSLTLLPSAGPPALP